MNVKHGFIAVYLLVLSIPSWSDLPNDTVGTVPPSAPSTESTLPTLPLTI